MKTFRECIGRNLSIALKVERSFFCYYLQWAFVIQSTWSTFTVASCFEVSPVFSLFNVYCNVSFLMFILTFYFFYWRVLVLNLTESTGLWTLGPHQWCVCGVRTVGHTGRAFGNPGRWVHFVRAVCKYNDRMKQKQISKIMSHLFFNIKTNVLEFQRIQKMYSIQMKRS